MIEKIFEELQHLAILEEIAKSMQQQTMTESQKMKIMKVLLTVHMKMNINHL